MGIRAPPPYQFLLENQTNAKGNILYYCWKSGKNAVHVPEDTVAEDTALVGHTHLKMSETNLKLSWEASSTHITLVLDEIESSAKIIFKKGKGVILDG